MADLKAKKYDSKDLTQCGVCLLTLQDPKALPCLHSFCMKCLSQWANGKTKVTCPLCVQEFEMPSGGVGAFRTNFFVNTLKERDENARTIQSKDAVVSCADCSSLDIKVEGYCTSCWGFICGDCVGNHCKIKSLSYHKVTSYLDLQSGKVDIRNLHPKKLCKVHEGQALRFFCETCGELLCRYCTLVDHLTEGRALVNLDNAAKSQKLDIEKLSRSVEDVQKRFGDALKEVGRVSEQLQSNARTAEQEIDEAFDKTHGLVENDRIGLKGELKTIVSERTKYMNTVKVEIHLQQTRLMTVIQMANQVVQTGSDYDLALVYSYLKTNLTTLRDMKPPLTKTNLGDVSFTPTQASQNVTHNLGSISYCCLSAKERIGVWKIIRVFGNEGAGKLKGPGGRGATITQQGDIAIADHSDASIKRYNTNGDFRSKIKVTSGPWNIAESQDGRMFVTNWTKQVSVYDVDGNLKQQFPTVSPNNVSADDQSIRLKGLAFDNHNNLLVGELEQSYISKHQSDGTHLMSFKVAIRPWYIAVSPHDKIIVSAFNNHAVHILDENGTRLHTLKPPPGLSSWNPHGICCTSDDKVYVVNNELSGSGSVNCYSTETGDFIGCLTKELRYSTGLALMDDENKLIVVEFDVVNILQRLLH